MRIIVQFRTIHIQSMRKIYSWIGYHSGSEPLWSRVKNRCQEAAQSRPSSGIRDGRHRKHTRGRCRRRRRGPRPRRRQPLWVPARLERLFQPPSLRHRPLPPQRSRHVTRWRHIPASPTTSATCRFLTLSGHLNCLSRDINIRVNVRPMKWSNRIQQWHNMTQLLFVYVVFGPIVQILIIHNLDADRGSKVICWPCLSVCLFVCWLNFTLFSLLCILPVAVAWPFSDGVAIPYVLLDYAMFSYYGTIGGLCRYCRRSLQHFTGTTASVNCRVRSLASLLHGRPNGCILSMGYSIVQSRFGFTGKSNTAVT